MRTKMRLTSDPTTNYTSNLKHIKIPEGVTEIAAGSFANRDDIEAITLPESLRIIEEDTFKYCRYLKTINFPNKLHTIGDNAFLNCHNLGFVTLPKELRSIGEYAFAGTGIQAIDIPPHVKELALRTFYRCQNLETVRLANVRKIGQLVFSDCNILKTVKINKNCQTIHHGAFSGCTSLKQIRLPESIRYIGPSAFNNTGLTEIKLPEQLIELTVGVFSENPYLTKVHIGDHARAICPNAFANCVSLTQINVPNALLCVDTKAFKYCNILDTTPFEPFMQPSLFAKYVQENTPGKRREDFLQNDIRILQLSKRITNCLRNVEINTIKSLTEKSFSDLFAIKGLGRVSAVAIKKELEFQGFSLKDTWNKKG